MRADRLRPEYPVFERVAYLNSGTFGPIPAATLRAAADIGLQAAEEGRSIPYFERRGELADSLRGRYARALGADAADVSLVSSTSDGIVRTLGAYGVTAQDVILTAPDEHPGLLGPLAQVRRLTGCEIRTAPLARIHEAVDADVTMVACSHVSWVDGSLAPTGLAEVARAGVFVLLDGAQGAGAVPIDLDALGCHAYAAAGQKWLCGPHGTGLLWLAPSMRERLKPTGPIYLNLEVPSDGLDAVPWHDGRAFDSLTQSTETLAAADAATGLLDEAGFAEVTGRAATLADQLVGMLQDAGRTVAPRDRTTLVSFEDSDPEATVASLREAGVVVRNLPGTPLVRASVGAYNDESDLERLVSGL